MHRVLEKEVIRFLRLIPLAEHRDLISHKVQGLARVHQHIHIERASLRELHLILAEDLVNNRLLSVNDLIVGQRKHMPFIVEIVHGKCQLARQILSLV